MPRFTHKYSQVLPKQPHLHPTPRLRLMRIVDLAWQNDPRLRWVSLKAPAESAVKVDSAPAPAAADGAGPEAPLPGSVAQQLAEKLAEEEKRKQDCRERLRMIELNHASPSKLKECDDLQGFTATRMGKCSSLKFILATVYNSHN